MFKGRMNYEGRRAITRYGSYATDVAKNCIRLSFELYPACREHSDATLFPLRLRNAMPRFAHPFYPSCRGEKWSGFHAQHFRFASFFTPRATVFVFLTLFLI